MEGRRFLAKRGSRTAGGPSGCPMFPAETIEALRSSAQRLRVMSLPDRQSSGLGVDTDTAKTALWIQSL